MLSAAGATVIVPARTPDKARAALTGMDRVELDHVELSDPASIDAFAARFLASNRPLHILVNNAGIMATPLRSGVDFDDPNFDRRPYDKWIAYGQSKSANALFAVALDARGEAHRVRAFSVHPGGVITELMRSMSDEEVRAVLDEPRNAPSTLKTVEQGAATSVWCAASSQLDGMGGRACPLPCEANNRRAVTVAVRRLSLLLIARTQVPGAVSIVDSR